MASLLNYGEPEILELFKNTLPSKLYWILFPINNLREAVEVTKRVMNKEKLDKQLTGQSSNISPFMKLGDDTTSAQQKMLNPQEIEVISSRVYNMSLQQNKTAKPFKPQVYQRRGRSQTQNYDRNGPRNNFRQGQNFGQNRRSNNYRRNGYTQILVEIMAEVEAEILTEITVMTGVDQEKEGYHLEGIIIAITDKTQILEYGLNLEDQGPGVDPTQG